MGELLNYSRFNVNCKAIYFAPVSFITYFQRLDVFKMKALLHDSSSSFLCCKK